MLQLLREAGTALADGALPYVRDDHPIVRREALLLALSLPAEREQALALGLRDSDSDMVRLAAAAAQEALPVAVVPILAARTGDELLDDAVRVELIELLGRADSPLAAEPLLRLVVRGRTLLRRARIAAPSPVVIAALHALATLSTPPARVAEVLERARRSRLPEIRSAVTA
jgi:hypothetical protein